MICGAIGEGGVMRAAACAVRISIREYTPESMLLRLHPPTPSAMPASWYCHFVCVSLTHTNTVTKRVIHPKTSLVAEPEAL